MRLLALFSVLAAVACGIAAAGAVAGDGAARPRSATVGALRFSHPARFDRRYYASCKYMVTGLRGACVGGVVVASFALGLHPEEPGAFFPPNRVAFKLYLAARRRPPVVAPAVRFPLSLADFHRVGLGPYQSNQQRELFFRVKSVNYSAMAWVGTRASKADRAALASVISSLRVK